MRRRPDNSDSAGDACREACIETTCVDGVVDTDEACDDPNGIDVDACRNACISSVEECDDGDQKGDVAGDACRAN